MKTSSEHPKPKLYLLLLAIQISGAIVFIWQQLPEFRQVGVNPGAQLPHDTFSDLGRRSLRDANLVLGPVAIYACLFALFCASLEVERLGQAFEGHRN
jgi:hypothetical protein